MHVDHATEIELVEHEQAMWALLEQRDFGALEHRLSPDFRHVGSGGITTRAELLTLLHDVTLLSYDLHGFHVMPLSADTFLLLYSADQTLRIAGDLDDTHAQRYASSMWRRGDEDWTWVFHMETPRT